MLITLSFEFKCHFLALYSQVFFFSYIDEIMEATLNIQQKKESMFAIEINNGTV